MTGLYKSTCSNKSCGTVNPLTSVVLLWTSERDTWSFGTPYSDGCPQSTTAKFSLITDGVRALPPKKALATRSPYSLPEYIFPDLPRDVIHSVLARSDCVSAAWNPSSSPSTCDLCEADDDVQDEQHADFHCTHPPIQCLFAGDMSPYSQEARAQDVFLLFCTRTTTLYFST